MLNRWLGILCIGAMLTANTALFVRDVLPRVLAADPPPSDLLTLQTGQTRETQVRIHSGRGETLGYSWTISKRTGGMLQVQSWTVLDRLHLPQGIVSPRLQVRMMLNYQNDRLDALDFEVFGLKDFMIKLHGEYVTSEDFAFKWQIGYQIGNFILPAETTQAVGDVIRPFDRLPELYIGRTWMVKLFDPISALLPNWNRSVVPDAILVSVTGQEEIEHNGARINAFIVEADKVTAYVAADGRVLRQEVELPLVGRVVLDDEPYNEQLRIAWLREANFD